MSIDCGTDDFFGSEKNKKKKYRVRLRRDG